MLFINPDPGVGGELRQHRSPRDEAVRAALVHPAGVWADGVPPVPGVEHLGPNRQLSTGMYIYVCTILIQRNICARLKS